MYQCFLRSITQGKRNKSKNKQIGLNQTYKFCTTQETIKFLEKNIGRTHFDINCSNNFLDLSPKAKEIKAKINKWNLIKPKSFCTTKEIIDQKKDKLLNGRKY